MNGKRRRVIEGLTSLWRPAPSLFDWVICGIFGIYFFKGFRKELFFFFYCVFLILITIPLKPKREYTSLPLFMMAVWSFVCMFVHSFEVLPFSITFYYKGLYIMFEGFLYLFLAVMFVITAIKYTTNLRFILFFLPLFLYPFFNDFKVAGYLRWTPVLALIVGVGFYLLLKRRYIWSALLLLFPLTFVIAKKSFFFERFRCRIYVLEELFQQIKQHPFFGTGFNNTINPDNMIFTLKGANGWLYRHNDWSSMTAYLGLPMLLWLSLFIVESYRGLSALAKSVIIGMLILSTFQMTVFFMDKMVIYLILIVMILSTKKEAVC